MQPYKYGPEFWEFSDALLRAKDLDPLYPKVGRLSRPTLDRFLVAYWCFYHAGVASVMSTMGDGMYWGKLAIFASERTTPRGSERRHFRGTLANNTVKDLAGRYRSPTEMVDYLIDGALDYASLAKRVQEHVGFGPWIAFKIGDMLERLGLASVDFSGANLSMYREPARGASLLIHGNPDYLVTEPEMQDLIHEVQGWSLREGFLAPPNNDRMLNLQEVETLLCKFKSHMGGHYPVGKDTHEIELALAAYTSRYTPLLLG